jgi:hypothetical protein
MFFLPMTLHEEHGFRSSIGRKNVILFFNDDAIFFLEKGPLFLWGELDNYFASSIWHDEHTPTPEASLLHR